MTMITPENMHQFATPAWQPPASTRITSDLSTALWATFKSPEFNHQIIPGRFVEAFAGEYVELLLALHVHRARFSLVRRPPHSKAALNSRRLPLDEPGLYVIRATLDDAWSQDVGIACFPPDAEKHLGYPDRRDAAQRRLRLRAIVRDSRVTPETVIASLEHDDPMCGMGGAIVGARPLPKGAGGGADVAFSVNSYHAGV